MQRVVGLLDLFSARSGGETPGRSTTWSLGGLQELVLLRPLLVRVQGIWVLRVSLAAYTLGVFVLSKRTWIYPRMSVQ